MAFCYSSQSSLGQAESLAVLLQRQSLVYWAMSVPAALSVSAQAVHCINDLGKTTQTKEVKALLVRCAQGPENHQELLARALGFVISKLCGFGNSYVSPRPWPHP